MSFSKLNSLRAAVCKYLACEQAHWEKGEPARNHALYSIIPFSHLLNANQSAPTAINKLSN